MDRVLALHAGSRGFDSRRGHMSERFFRSNRPGYPHPVSAELENSGIRVAIGDCSVTERRRWRPPYQTGKTVHVHAKHYKHNEDGRTVRRNRTIMLKSSCIQSLTCFPPDGATLGVLTLDYRDSKISVLQTCRMIHVLCSCFRHSPLRPESYPTN